jgi:hypothetical protein
MKGTECAFPTGHDGDPGMTVRDHLASMAMQGILADSEVSADKPSMAKWCYDMADAMIAESQKGD